MLQEIPTSCACQGSSEVDSVSSENLPAAYRLFTSTCNASSLLTIIVFVFPASPVSRKSGSLYWFAGRRSLVTTSAGGSKSPNRLNCSGPSCSSTSVSSCDACRWEWEAPVIVIGNATTPIAGGFGGATIGTTPTGAASSSSSS